jgi:hypothetical protein
MTHPTKAIIPLMLEDGRKIEERDAKKSSNTTYKQNFGNMQTQVLQGQEEVSIFILALLQLN